MFVAIELQSGHTNPIAVSSDKGKLILFLKKGGWLVDRTYTIIGEIPLVK